MFTNKPQETPPEKEHVPSLAQRQWKITAASSTTSTHFGRSWGNTSSRGWSDLSDKWCRNREEGRLTRPRPLRPGDGPPSRPCLPIHPPPIGSPSQDSREGWIKAFPTASETAGVIAEHLVRDIIPRFSLPSTIQSDNGPAFVSKITAAVFTSLGIQWKLHAAYHPQSSGKVERVNGLIKEHLTKLALELRQSWVTLLPIALTRLRASPQGPSQLSPFELPYGWPFLLSSPLPPDTPLLPTYLPYFTLLRALLPEHANTARLLF
ncbi:uncharacterized protein LOC144577233 [Callithrix jacchus]